MGVWFGLVAKVVGLDGLDGLVGMSGGWVFGLFWFGAKSGRCQWLRCFGGYE